MSAKRGGVFYEIFHVTLGLVTPLAIVKKHEVNVVANSLSRVTTRFFSYNPSNITLLVQVILILDPF